MKMDRQTPTTVLVRLYEAEDITDQSIRTAPDIGVCPATGDLHMRSSATWGYYKETILRPVVVTVNAHLPKATGRVSQPPGLPHFSAGPDRRDVRMDSRRGPKETTGPPLTGVMWPGKAGLVSLDNKMAQSVQSPQPEEPWGDDVAIVMFDATLCPGCILEFPPNGFIEARLSGPPIVPHPLPALPQKDRLGSVEARGQLLLEVD
ncbi:hypothetical protein LX32DRAFT_267997 [Colletotrichum zoysiae]|uniref:Uncharacterized protein n=1 Tax=Colletotrichum zoysiae TaxID=1216348 RepID=A0AAD9HME4_9PEZI|nr:hypothetical protein LX32DRAFT_267997 [Colletotrichum zoysiae]